MSKTSKITATMQDAQLASVDAYAASYGISRSEALGRLVSAGLENLTRAEELKNFVIRRQEALEKKLQIELSSLRKLELMSLRFIAGMSAVGRTHYGQQFGIAAAEVEKLSDAGIAKMISELKNNTGDTSEFN